MAAPEPGVPEGNEVAHVFDHVVEVSADAHASGTHTLQEALNALPASGGVVKLGPGVFEIRGTATPAGVPVRIVGAGPSLTTITGEAFVLRPAPYVELADLGFKGMYRGVELTDGGAYGYLAIRNVEFRDIEQHSVYGNVEGPLEGVTVTGCKFEKVYHGLSFRADTSQYFRIYDNEFLNVGNRSIMIGSKIRSGGSHGAEIINNRIRHTEQPDSDVQIIGILSYTDDTIIADNHIENLYSQGRHEAISSRGDNSIIRNNTIINAGGDTAAISTAGGGPTLIKDNVIRFTDDHKGKRDGIDIRQSRQLTTITGNTITGTEIAIYFRRGGPALITNNSIGDSSHQKYAVAFAISTGAVIHKEAMRDVRIEGNTFAGIRGDTEEFRAIHFNIRGHAGEGDARMDDVVIANNTFKDIDVPAGSVGVYFESLERDGTGMRNVVIEGNDFRALTDPIHRTRRYVEDLRIANNQGFEGK